jgi:hypothetical protein
MSAQFAWPVCHRPAGDYNLVAGTVCLGRPFRQPLLLPDVANFSEGLELWLRAGTEAVALSACFAGFITFYPATPTQPATLKLQPFREVTDRLRRLNMLEPLPSAFVYANVDRATVRQVLINLITAAYTAATGQMKTWHPVMRDFKWQNQRLKRRLDNTKPEKRPALIEQIVDRFLNNSATDANARLLVLAGNSLGEATTAFGGATPPATCPFATDATPPRHFVFKVEERCNYVRNPLHDLWTWLNKSTGTNPLIQLLAPHNLGSANPHPIAQVTSLTLTTPKPLPRSQTNPPLQPIPMLELADFHYRDNARVEWQLTDDGLLESHLRPGQPTPAPNLNPPANIVNLINRMWGLNPSQAGYANDIVDMAVRFQVPCELIMAFLGKETSNLDERVVRFEPVNNTQRIKTDAKFLADPTYQNLSNQYMAVIPANGFAINVPNPWNNAAVIRTVGANQFTWGEMAQLLDLSPYFRTRLSPGLMQTLISTASSTLDWIEAVFPDIQDTYPDTATAPHSWWTYFRVAQRPATPSGYLNDWLLIPRHAIFVGTAYIRKLYNTDKQGTCWDPAKQAAAYNAGSVCNPCGLAGKTPTEQNLLRTWGMCYYGDYMTRFGQAYNAAVNLFNNNPTIAPAPPVRLRR